MVLLAGALRLLLQRQPQTLAFSLPPLSSSKTSFQSVGIGIREFSYDSPPRSVRPKVPPKFKTQSMWNQIRSFPKNAGNLYNDVLTYRNIDAAACTLNNAWGGVVPRRQRAFKRRLEQGLVKVLIPVVGWVAVPVFGSLFIILAVAFPRMMLSYHFLSEKQMRVFAAEECAHRLKYYREVGSYVETALRAGGICLAGAAKGENIGRRGEEYETAGKGIAAGDFAELFESCFAPLKSPLPDLSSLSRPHLLALAHASGAVPPPHYLTTPLFNLVPSSLIERRVSLIMLNILIDDIQLLKEGHQQRGCSDLTDDELLEACLERGLPAGMDVKGIDMRRSLTSHLDIMDRIAADRIGHNGKSVVSTREGEVIGLFALHLPALKMWIDERGRNVRT